MGRYVENSGTGAENLVDLVLAYRQQFAEVNTRFTQVSVEIDNKIAQFKNELLGGASAAFDTFKELEDLFIQHRNLIEELQRIAGKHVRFDTIQSLTLNEKAIARSNISAVSMEDVNTAIDGIVGISPTATVNKVDKVATITITDHNGTTTAQINDGEIGPVYQPYVTDDGVITWSNNGGLPNPAAKSIRGPVGPRGEAFKFTDFTPAQLEQLRGPEGQQGEAFTFDDFTPEQLDQLKGPEGQQGIRGPQGVTFTPMISADGTVSWTNDGSLPNPTPVNVSGPEGKTPQVHFRLDEGGGLYYKVTYV